MSDGDADNGPIDVTQSWIIGVASVVFDIDQGQTLECLYPEGIITEEEGRDVAFNSFPDSMSMELHAKSSIRDSTFFFRIMQRPSSHNQPADQAGVTSQILVDRSHYHNQRQEYLYGFVFCRQRQDSRLKRGGEQKSLVLLTQQPFSHALSQVSQWAGPLYFNQGTSALQEVYKEVMEFQPPDFASRQLLRAGRITLVAQIPDILTLPPPEPQDRADALANLSLRQALPTLEGMAGCFPEIDIYTPLKAILIKAWAVWELVLLAQPLMVAARSPGECSSAVAAVIALISPLPYSADFRPYYTIHDQSFSALLASQLPDNSNSLPRLLGITNLYFLKALPSWPNVLSTGAQPTSNSGESGGRDTPSRLSRLDQVMRRKATGSQALLSHHQEALWMAYKPLTKPDKDLLERLLKPQATDNPVRAARMASTNSGALRNHFSQLTVALLEPFERFIQPTPPPPGDSPLPEAEPPPLPPFSHAEFLEQLDKKDQLPAMLLKRFSNKAACLQFYRRFLESPNFVSWFERRRGRAALWQEGSWAEAALERGRFFELENCSEVRLIEAFGALEKQLENALKNGGTSDSVSHRCHLLRKQMSHIYQRMPRDLQSCILSNPARAALLHRPASAPRVPGQAHALSRDRFS